MKKDSARCVKNRVNLCTRMCSISSACFILMLTRILLMLGSISTRSFSLRAIVSGVNSTSGEVCASISGTLWRSAVWDAKLERQRAAVRLLRTAWRYGRRDWDWRKQVSGQLNRYGVTINYILTILYVLGPSTQKLSRQ